MNISLVLRLAALIAVLQSFGHGFMHITYTPKHGPDEVALVTAMKTHPFVFGGFTRSYWDFYFGYGLVVAFGCFVQGVALWLLAAPAQTQPAPLRPLLGALIAANLAAAALTGAFFFLLPVVFYLLIAGCLALALFATRSQLV